MGGFAQPLWEWSASFNANSVQGWSRLISIDSKLMWIDCKQPKHGVYYIRYNELLLHFLQIVTLTTMFLAKHKSDSNTLKIFLLKSLSLNIELLFSKLDELSNGGHVRFHSFMGSESLGPLDQTRCCILTQKLHT